MSPAAVRVWKHVMLYGLARVWGDPWCPVDYTHVVEPGTHPNATGMYPYIFCNPITLAEVKARIGLPDERMA